MIHSLICPSLFWIFIRLLVSLCAVLLPLFGLLVCLLVFSIWSVVCCVLLFGLLIGVASPSWSVGRFVGFAIWSVVCCGLHFGVLLPLVGLLVGQPFSLESLPLDTPPTKWPSSYTLIQTHTTLSLSTYVEHSLFFWDHCTGSIWSVGQTFPSSLLPSTPTP